MMNFAAHGAEVAQLYLGFPAAAGEPPQVLRGFQKLHLAPGAEATATFELGAGDLSVWSAEKHEWSPVSGKFGVFVGASSRDILLKVRLFTVFHCFSIILSLFPSLLSLFSSLFSLRRAASRTGRCRAPRSSSSSKNQRGL